MDDDQKKCGGITLGGLLMLILVIALFAMGFMYYDSEIVSTAKEPCFQTIPILCMAGAVLILVTFVARVIIQRCCRKAGEIGNDSKLCSSLNFACKFSATMIFDAIAMLAYLIWLIVLTVSTMEINGNITFTGGESSFESLKSALGDSSAGSGGAYICDARFYDFAFWTCIGLWISFLLTFFLGLLAKFCTCFYNVLCCRPCKSASENRQNNV